MSSAILRELLVRSMPNAVVRHFARPYVAGLGSLSAIERAVLLWKERSIRSTLDLLGEAVSGDAEAKANVASYLCLIREISQSNAAGYCSISVKLSALGLAQGEESCFKSLEILAQESEQRTIDLTIDMEDSSTTDVTLRIYKLLRERYNNIGTVLQTRLFRTEGDIRSLPTGGRVRLVIGIYREPATIAVSEKARMKAELVRLVPVLLAKENKVEVATHDRNTILQVLESASRIASSEELLGRLEFQMLLGVPCAATQQLLLERGFAVRLYLPFARSWPDATAYLKRRLIENPEIVSYAIHHFFAQDATTSTHESA